MSVTADSGVAPGRSALAEIFGAIRPRPRGREFALLVMASVTLVVGAISLNATIVTRGLEPATPMPPDALALHGGPMLPIYLGALSPRAPRAGARGPADRPGAAAGGRHARRTVVCC